MAALASMGPLRDTRPVVRAANGREYRRGEASAVDLTERLGRRTGEMVAWEPVVASGDEIVDFRRELQAARAAGATFDNAWVIARARIAETLPVGHHANSSGTFVAVVNATKAVWRDAYEQRGRPPRYADALLALRDAALDSEAAHYGPAGVRTVVW